jgi:hypothetical protein
MADRPILFSAPMVRALLSGNKTQTRRIMKPQPPRFMHYGKDIMDWGLSGVYQDEDNEGTNRWWLDVQTDVDDNSHTEFKVSAAVGDRLWVRESLRCEVDEADVGFGMRKCPYYVYAADGEAVDDHTPAGVAHKKSVPSIHMWRWASRITLIVTDVRVQSLQDISEADAIAEGIERANDHPVFRLYRDYCAMPKSGTGAMPPVDSFRTLWNSINGAGAWEQNPWVVAYSFTVHHCNIDQMDGADG